MSTIESRVLFEVPVESLEEAVAAVQGGADRLELCALLAEDGITPPLEILDQFGRQSPAPFVAMIRPHSGDFIYSANEINVMEESIRAALDRGAMGVVLGALTPDRHVSAAQCEKLISAAGDGDKVFHRAFDQIADPFSALDTLIALGFTRVLTSGGGDCAADAGSLQRIAKLITHANGRIEILPGGGIRPSNVRALIDAARPTGIHSSCRRGQKQDAKLDPKMVVELRSEIDAC